MGNNGWVYSYELPYVRNAQSTLEDFIQFAFIKQLWVSGFHWFQFHCNFLLVKQANHGGHEHK